MAEATHPGTPESWYREAERALAAREYQRAHAACLKILQRSPGHAGALYLLGVLAIDHANFAKALELLERAVAADPHRPECHAQLGRCWIALRRPRQAYEAASKALDLAPTTAYTWDTIGVVLARAGAHAQAVLPARRAVELAPQNASYQYNLGASLQFVGDFAGARSAYETAIATNPRHFRSWVSLAQVSRRPFAPEQLQGLHEALDGPLSADEELQICHALAKHYEESGDYPASFRFLERGKRRRRPMLEHTLADDAELFRAATSIQDRAALHAPVVGHPSCEPIFIVGMPRTGTTLVERILSSHREVFAAGELPNWLLEVKRASATRTRKILDVPTLEAAGRLDPAALGAAYVESTRPRTGHTRYFIDKLPLNFLYAGLIHRALPNAKIICLRRNALDACLSNYRQLFAARFEYYNYTYDLLDTGRYYQMFDALATHWRQCIPRNYCEVHYESIVMDTEQEARKLIAFCGLEWDPACLSFHENAAPVATASSVQVRQPIYKTSVARWRKYERELAPLRALLGSE